MFALLCERNENKSLHESLANGGKWTDPHIVMSSTSHDLDNPDSISPYRSKPSCMNYHWNVSLLNVKRKNQQNNSVTAHYGRMYVTNILKRSKRKLNANTKN